MALPSISDIGRIIKDPSILKGTFSRAKPDVVYSLDEGVARTPTIKEGGRPGSYKYVSANVPSQDVGVSLPTALNLPEISNLPAPTYDPGTGMYTSVSPTGYRGTVYSRPPTPQEREVIIRAQEEGSFGNILEKVEKKVVTPVLEKIEPVTSFFLDIPFTSAATDIEARINKRFGGIDTRTVGERIVAGKEAAQGVADVSKANWLDISRQFFKKAEEYGTGTGKIKGNIFETLGYVSKGAAGVVGASPTIFQYTLLTPAGGAAVDILATEQKKKDIEKYYTKELDRQYSEYAKEYAKEQANLEEGYELEPLPSRTEFEEKYGGDIMNLVETEIRREAVIPFVILGTAGAAKLGKGLYKFGKPEIIESSIKGGESRTLNFLEKQIPVSTEEGIKLYSKFKLMDIRTPVTAYKQSVFGRLIGLEPKLVVLQRGQTYISEPVANILGKLVDVDKPYILRTGRVGKGGEIVNVKFLQIGGKDVGITREGLLTLPKPEQYLWKNIVEKFKTGTPVNYERLPTLFGEGESLQLGTIRELRIAKIGTGRSTIFSRVGSITKPIKEFESGAGTFKVTTGFKDVTFPYYRAAGNIPTRSGVIIRYPTITPDVGTGVDIFAGGGKKSSKQFLEQLYKLEKPTPITKPVITIPKANIPKVTTTITTTLPELPYMVGGTGLKTLPFAGTGTYEVSEGGILPGITLPGITGNVVLGDTGAIQDVVISDVNIIQDARLKITPEVIQQEKLQLDIFQQPKQIEKVKVFEISKEKQKPMEKVISKSALKLISKQAAKQVQKQTAKQIQKQVQKQKVRKTPIKTIPKLFPPKGFGEGKKKKGLVPEDFFEVFVRKGGKDISVGEFETLPEARQKLFGTIREEIRASGFIQKRGKPIKLEIIGTEFLRGKKEPFRVVEPRRRRIKRGTSEVFQIQSERKQSRKKGWFS